MSLIQLKDVSKIYGKDESKTIALDNININIEKGDFLSIMGPSGSGKSTFLNIVGCMDVATQGEYYLDNILVNKLKNNELSKIRNEKVSFIFQHFALMKDYSIYDNIALPLMYRKITNKDRNILISKYAERLGIHNQLKKKPGELSGGQQQRVAIARALVSESQVILADEPTGALDQKTGQELLNLLKEINNEGKTIILITHDEKVARQCSRSIYIRDGKLNF